MSIIDSLLSVLAPYDCLACGREGSIICDDCQRQLPIAAATCYRCLRTSTGGRTCNDCRLTSLLRRVQAVTLYSGLAKQLIWQFKFMGMQAAAQLMARQMAALLPGATGTVLVPLPTATSRVRQRGYDHTRLLARELRRQTALPIVDCLARHGQAQQHGASRRQRLAQLGTAFRVRQPRRIAGRRVLLVDDVLTTGATLESAAKVLMAAGAQRVEAVVFAQTPLPHIEPLR